MPSNADELTTLELFGARIKHLILPLFCMTYGGLAGLSRYMRSSMAEVIRMDYVRLARAKGLRERAVIYKHALRNSLIPIITLMGGLLPGMIGGSVIIEAIFGVPGMGFLAFNAIRNFDYTVLMADITLVAFLVLIGYLISDLLYVAADPRITFESKGA
jgi:peptide/nickel transport system permease protein